MARLTIEQVRAPDLTGTSEILARAGLSFQAATESAAGLLGKYQEGQKVMGDKQILTDLAKIKDEAGLDDYLAQNPLAEKNLSQGMMDHILGLRSDTIGFAADRANVDGTLADTASTRAGTIIKNAAEGRTAAEYTDSVAARAEGRALGSQLFGAAQAGRAQGNNAGVGGDTSAVQAQVYQGMIDRGLPEHIAEGFMMNFQDESGFNPGVTESQDNVHGTRGKGLYQLTGVRRDAFEAKFGNDYSIDNQLDFMVDELKGGESKAAASIFGAKTAGEAGAAIVKDFLRPEAGYRDKRMASYLGSNGAPRPTAITVNPATRGPADAMLANAFAGSKYMDFGQMMGVANSIYDSQATGQAAIDAAETKAANERRAATEMGILGDENIVTASDALNASLARANGVNSTEDLAQLQSMAAATGEGGPLSGLLSTGSGMSDADQAAADLRLGNVATAQGTDASVRALRGSRDFSSDPIGSLRSALGDRGASGLDNATLELEINKLADDLRILPEEAAYAFAQVAADNKGINADSIFSIGGDGLSQNKAYRFAEKMFAGGNREETNTRLSNDDVLKAEASKLYNEVARLKLVVQKSERQNGEASPTAKGNYERAAAELASVLSRLPGN